MVEFGFICLFVLAAIGGIAALSLCMRGKANKAPYIVGVVTLSVLLAAALAYGGLVLLLILSIM